MEANVDQVIAEAQLYTDTASDKYHKVYCAAERAGLPARAVAHEAAIKLGLDEDQIRALEAWY